MLVRHANSKAGTSASYESDTSGSSKTAAIVHDTTNNKILVVYGDAANSDYGTAVVGTVSGTSISLVLLLCLKVRMQDLVVINISVPYADDKIVIVYKMAVILMLVQQYMVLLVVRP